MIRVLDSAGSTLVEWARQQQQQQQESRSQNKAALHAVCDAKWLRLVNIESNLSVMVLVQLDRHLLKNRGQTICLRTSHGSIESILLLFAFFLELTEDEHNVCRTSVRSAVTLAVGGVASCDDCYEIVE